MPAPVRASHRHIQGVKYPPLPFPDSGYFAGTACLNNPAYAGSYFCRQHLPRRGFGYAFAPIYGFSYWPGFEDYSSQPQEQAPAAPAPEQDAALAGQVERLTEEVELLREDRSSPAALSPAAAPAPPEEHPAALLVYRDGRKGEAANYAVLGQTLYVFEGERTRKIPLAALDLAATQRLNEERGVEFVPSPTP